MPVDIGREMALPMDQIIGGPLQAVVKAQALAASTTADFIQQVGLQTQNNQQVARTVDFSFQRKTVGDNDTVQTENVSLNVPLLAILPVPWIRVEEATVDFECKVSSSTRERMIEAALLRIRMRSGIDSHSPRSRYSA